MVDILLHFDVKMTCFEILFAGLFDLKDHFNKFKKNNRMIYFRQKQVSIFPEQATGLFFLCKMRLY